MEYDVAIIGGGPGGYVAAIRAAQLGQKTVLIEKKTIGGTCLNVGCIPTKALIKNAEILHEVKNAKKRGLLIGTPEVDMPEVIKMKNAVVSKLTGGVQMLLKGNGVDVIKGEAKVISENSLTAAGQEITFKNLIVATGSSNFIPPVPGLAQKGICTSTEMLELDHVPESIAIIGGGVIGCEIATIFSNFGSNVTIIEMMPTILPLMDKDVSNTLKSSLTSGGVKVLTNCKVTAVEKRNDKFVVKMVGEKEESIETEKILVSVGRRSNLAGLESLGLELESGYIKVNNKMETNRKNIYAIGDVTGKIQLAHVASAQGIVAVENIAGRNSLMSYETVPNCVYAIPEIGSVGLTEAKAKELYGDVTVGKFPMVACGKALAMGQTTGFTKLVAEKSTGRLLGCHIVGPNATEIIGEAAAVMHNSGTLKDIAQTIHGHPTIGETMMEAAHVAMGEPIHTMKA